MKIIALGGIIVKFVASTSIDVVVNIILTQSPDGVNPMHVRRQLVKTHTGDPDSYGDPELVKTHTGIPDV